MLTLKEQLESIENAIEKVKNSQEYRIGASANRYALLEDLQKEREALLSLVTCEDDLSLTLVQLQIKNRTRGRNYVSYS